MTIIPQGEDIRRAVKWISEMRQDDSQADPRQLVQDASIKFNLSPLDAEYLSRWVKGEAE